MVRIAISAEAFEAIARWAADPRGALADRLDALAAESLARRPWWRRLAG